MPSNNKVILITAGTSGIGFELVRQFYKLEKQVNR